MVSLDGMRDITRRVDVLRARYADRDGRMMLVRAVRAGNLGETVFGDLFPREWSKPIVANFVDVAARDLAEMLAPLPTFSCAGASMLDDSKRNKADKRTRMVNAYVEASKLQRQMYTGADWYGTYGFLPFRVEPNAKDMRPHITIEDPVGSYPEFDRWGNCTAFYRRYHKTVDELCALFPEYAGAIRGPGLANNGQGMLEVIRWVDDDREMLFLPERQSLVLRAAVNPLGKCPVVVAQRPSFDGEQRGQFDDVLWVQMARSKFALLALEAAHKSVEAPLAIPMDVQHLPLGGDAVVRSREPEKIRRVPIEIPQGTFATSQQLESEMRIGARYPESRSGNMDASVITGRGVQELQGGFESQIKSSQEILSDTLSEVAAMCLEMDEVLWPQVDKVARGSENGAPYEIKYRPEKDIKGEYMVDVTYGMMAGMDPNRALVWGLQARGDKLMSRSFLRRNMPVAMNVNDEEKVIDIEEMRDSAKQGMAGLAASIPMMVQSGQDPTKVIQAIAAVIDGRKSGKQIEDVLSEVFAPTPPDSPAPGAGSPGGEPNTDEATPGAPGGGVDDGLMPGVAPGQAAMGPGGSPDLMQLMASLRGNGTPSMTASVQRRQPI
jgi:hypothetical protein